MQKSKIKINEFFILGVSLFALFFVAHGAQAATYYVAKTGNDSNNCTQAQSTGIPKLTIAAGIACLSGGDTLIIKAGTYAEAIAPAAVPSGGGEESRTIIQGESAATTAMTIIRPNSGDAVIQFSNKSYVTLKYLTLDGVNVSSWGVSFQNASHHIRVEGCVIKNTGSGGGGVGAIDAATDQTTDRHHFEIVNNEIFNHGATTFDHGIYLRARDNLIAGNVIHDSRGYGIRTDRPISGISSDNNIMRNNRIYNNSRGINVGGGSNIQVYNNLIYSNGGDIDVGGIYIGNGNPNNARIYNNTVVSNQGYGVWISSGTGHIAKNNILWQNTVGAIQQATTGNTLSNNLATDPQFLSSSTNDFHLQSTSPAINVGVTLSEVTTDFDGVLRPQGSAYDIGAYEYVSGGTPTPPPAGGSSDLNSDGKVNSVDAAILMGAWGSTFKPKADINQDGIVNSVDASLMMGQWSL